MARNILIGVVLVVVLVAGGWWYLNQSSAPVTSETTQQGGNNSQPMVNNQPSQTTQSTSSGPKTYSNSAYGFSIKYPVSVEVTSTDPLKRFSDSGAEVFKAVVRDDSVQTEGYVSVTITPTPVDCPANSSKTSIGDTSFSVFNNTTLKPHPESGQARQYVAAHGDNCYFMDVVAFPSACINTGCTSRKWSEQTMTTMLDRLDTIALTFRFN